jgi:GMP synthase (glutamine-hydrolysing)
MEKELLIIRNIPRENPGLLEDILKEHGIIYSVVDLNQLRNISSIATYGAIVVLGGPDSANDGTEKMQTELALIREVLNAKISFLGICLGLQTLVKAAGGQVVKSPVKEIGLRDQDEKYFTVELTEEGKKDPLFNGLDHSFNVFHLHGETVIISENMKLLATGKYCRNQIVKVGSDSYGIQCHFELTPEMFEIWINEDPDLQALDIEQLRSDFVAIKDKYSQTGRQLFKNYLRLAGYLC